MERAIDLAGELGGARVLDAGAGTGLLAECLRVRGRTPARLVAVDASAAMLQEMRRRGRFADEVHRADLRCLPLEDSSIDVAFLVYVLHILPSADSRSVLDELHRVLSDRGSLVVVTPWAASTAIGAAWRSLARLVSGTPAWQMAGLRPLDPAALLRERGFAPRRGVYVPRGYPALSVLAHACGGTEPGGT